MLEYLRHLLGQICHFDILHDLLSHRLKLPMPEFFSHIDFQHSIIRSFCVGTAEALIGHVLEGTEKGWRYPVVVEGLRQLLKKLIH